VPHRSLAVQSTAHAKGRIERNHGTQQDRLVKKLRRKGIADLEQANAFLETAYWADFNARFARPPAAADDYHVARPHRRQLDMVFRLEEKRTVSNDWVVRYANRLLQLERQSGQAPARSSVVVCEGGDGGLEIRYRDRVMRWTEIVASPAPATTATRPIAPAPPVGAPRGRAAGADHPWRQGFKQMGRDLPLWRVADR
jgi:hypothetical protein